MQTQTQPQKILVLQLARLGDLYQTWPVLRALRRMNPEADLHVLTRERFAAAMKQGETIDCVWTFDSRQFLEPLIDERPALDESLEKLASFCTELRAETFDRVINLSFSPFSSYLTREIATAACDVSGYTRFHDGYLSVPDDGSAYFYGQVGVGRPNRLHVTDLFAHVAGVDLIENDWNALEAGKVDHLVPTGEYVVLHAGASDLRKTLSSPKWQQIARIMLDKWEGNLVLVGSSEEREISELVAAVSGPRKPINLVGRTTVREMESIVAGARLVIGADSAPMQIASLADTPALNISLPAVSFWETGPRSSRSRILPVTDEALISAEEIVDEALGILRDRHTYRSAIRVPGPTFPYIEARPQPMAFEWDLLRAIYLGENFPSAQNKLFTLAMEKLQDLNNLALEQIAEVRKNPSNKTATVILDQVDQLMGRIKQEAPQVAPIVRWFATERVRIGPAPFEVIVATTQELHERLGHVVALYVNEPTQQQGVAGDNIHVE